MLPETKGRSLEEMDIIFGAVRAEDRDAKIKQTQKGTIDFWIHWLIKLLTFILLSISDGGRRYARCGIYAFGGREGVKRSQRTSYCSIHWEAIVVVLRSDELPRRHLPRCYDKLSAFFYLHSFTVSLIV